MMVQKIRRFMYPKCMYICTNLLTKNPMLIICILLCGLTSALYARDERIVHFFSPCFITGAKNCTPPYCSSKVVVENPFVVIKMLLLGMCDTLGLHSVFFKIFFCC